LNITSTSALPSIWRIPATVTTLLKVWCNGIADDVAVPELMASALLGPVLHFAPCCKEASGLGLRSHDVSNTAESTTNDAIFANRGIAILDRNVAIKDMFIMYAQHTYNSKIQSFFSFTKHFCVYIFYHIYLV
jgi:hypothetical protein